MAACTAPCTEVHYCRLLVYTTADSSLIKLLSLYRRYMYLKYISSDVYDKLYRQGYIYERNQFHSGV